MTGLGLVVCDWVGLGWSVVPLQETPESARFSLVAPMVAVRWFLVGGGEVGVDIGWVLGEVVSSGGNDEVASLGGEGG